MKQIDLFNNVIGRRVYIPLRHINDPYENLGEYKEGEVMDVLDEKRYIVRVSGISHIVPVKFIIMEHDATDEIRSKTV